MELIKVRAYELDGQSRISHTFRNADGTGCVVDALVVDGGFAHFDYVAMKRDRSAGAIVAAERYETAELAARAAVANRNASAGSLARLRGHNDEYEQARRDDGPQGYGN